MLKAKPLVISTILLLPLLAVAPMARAETETLYPTDDCYVSSYLPDSTHNLESLETRADNYSGGFISRTYLKFNLTSIECESIGRTRLYLNCYAAGGPEYLDVDACQTGDYYSGTTTPWEENGLTWNNAPDFGDTIDTTKIDKWGGYFSWGGDTMKNYVKAECAEDGIVSFLMKLTVEDTTNPYAWHRVFHSKDWAHPNPRPPYLEILPAPTAWSTDDVGNAKSTFQLSDGVWVTGQDFPANDYVTLYLILDGEEALPANAVAHAFTMTKSSGDLLLTRLWSQPLTLGEYDIWVDVNQNGAFDGEDVWNSQSIGIYALDIIPEFATKTSILLVIILFTVALAIYKRRLPIDS